jgi:hypothetical protein
LTTLLEPRSPRRGSDEAAATAAVAAVEATLARRLPLLPTGCFARGLSLYYFLRRAGIDVGLTFGLATAGDETAGHCWLVREGRPYLEKVDPTELYTAVWTIRSPTHRAAATTRTAGRRPSVGPVAMDPSIRNDPAND